METLVEASAGKIQNGSRVSPIDLESIRRNPPRLLNRREAAAYLGLSLRTLSDLLAKRAIRVVKIGGRRVLRLCDLEAFVEKRIV